MINNLETELKTKWDSINYYDGGSLKLAIRHPLEWYVRYASIDSKSIVIISDYPVDGIVSSTSIEASCNQRNDGRYAISFTLINKSKEDVFISMSCDIIQYSMSENTVKSSLNKVLRRYGEWLKLLEYKHSGKMSLNEQKGLVAELMYLKERIEQGMNVSDAIDGWVGPDGLDQDFIYSDGWHEVKATGVSSTKVSISSIEQLDPLSTGELIVYRIDKSAPAQNDAVTLYMTVHLLSDLLQPNTSILDTFYSKLASAGYIDKLEYNKDYFYVDSNKRYCVDKTFPKLIRSEIPVEISNAQYQIDLTSIEKWAK